MKSFFSQDGWKAGTKHTLRDAATVILLRDPAGEPYEVFLMRRHRNQAFMGGAYVFPGGRLDDADTDPGLAACVGGLRATDARRLLQEPDLPRGDRPSASFLRPSERPSRKRGYSLPATLRGRPVDLSDPETAARFAAYRLELHERTTHPGGSGPAGRRSATPPIS